MLELNLNLDDDYQTNAVHLERLTLDHLMHKTKYNQSKTAKLMGISRGTLRTKLNEHFGRAYFRDSE